MLSSKTENKFLFWISVGGCLPRRRSKPSVYRWLQGRAATQASGSEVVPQCAHRIYEWSLCFHRRLKWRNQNKRGEELSVKRCFFVDIKRYAFLSVHTRALQKKLLKHFETTVAFSTWKAKRESLRIDHKLTNIPGTRHKKKWNIERAYDYLL